MAANAKTKKYLESERYKEIEKDLLEQLEQDGTFGKYYIDLVSDYMDMWVTKCLLVDDIQHRGVQIRYDNGGGQKGYRKNDSIDQRVKINGQMLKLLTELGISPSKKLGVNPVSPTPEGEEDEL